MWQKFVTELFASKNAKWLLLLEQIKKIVGPDLVEFGEIENRLNLI